MKPALIDLAGRFESTSGHKLTIAYDSAGAVTKRIQSGEAADVVIIQKSAIDNAKKMNATCVSSIGNRIGDGLGASKVCMSVSTDQYLVSARLGEPRRPRPSLPE